MPFARWCFKTEGVHPETGRRREDRALARISAYLARRTVPNSDNGHSGVLPDAPEISDIDANIEAEAARAKRAYSWAADDAFTSILSDRPADFSWAEKRNERRRQREAQRRKHGKRLSNRTGSQPDPAIGKRFVLSTDQPASGLSTRQPIPWQPI